MALFFIRSPHRSEPEPSPRRRVSVIEPDSEQLEREVERHRQVAEQLHEVRANYSLERRSFF
jgi:hypothetical protein